MARIAYQNATNTSFTLYLTELDTNYGSADRQVWWWIQDPNNEEWDNVGETVLENNIYSGGYCTVNNLIRNTTYNVRAYIYFNNQTVTLSGTSTTANTARIAYTNLSYRSVTLYMADLDDRYSSNDRYIKWYFNSIYKGRSNLNAYDSLGGTITIDNLSPGTTYVVEANVYYNNEQDVASFSSTITTLSRPSYFSWTYTKTQGNTFNLTAQEWNGLLDNINAIRQYLGYLSYSFTSAVTGNIFYATMYNQVINAIKETGYGGNLSTVNPGDDITAARLNNIVTTLNNIS